MYIDKKQFNINFLHLSYINSFYNDIQIVSEQNKILEKKSYYNLKYKNKKKSRIYSKVNSNIYLKYSKLYQHGLFYFKKNFKNFFNK